MYEESPRHVATECASAEQEHPGILDAGQVELRHDAPPHQLQVQVDCLICESRKSVSVPADRKGVRRTE